MLQALEFLISFAVITGLFAMMMFKVLPDARVAWSDVWVGVALTALLFTIGNLQLVCIWGRVRLWCGRVTRHFLSMGLLLRSNLSFGAEFTQAYAKAVGRQISPSEDATVTDPTKAKDSRASPCRDPTCQTEEWRALSPASCVCSFLHIRGRQGLGQHGVVVGAVILGISLMQFLRRPAEKTNSR